MPEAEHLSALAARVANRALNLEALVSGLRAEVAELQAENSVLREDLSTGRDPGTWRAIWDAPGLERQFYEGGEAA